MSDRSLAGRCGMYCGSCPVYRAGHDGDGERIFSIAFSIRCTIDQVRCEGCGTPDRFALSRGCLFRKCANGRGLESCGLCQEFPCETLVELYGEDMRQQGGAEENARRINEVGLDQWLEEADARWRCKGCGNRIALDTKTCRACKAPIPPPKG